MAVDVEQDCAVILLIYDMILEDLQMSVLLMSERAWIRLSPCRIMFADLELFQAS